MKTKFFLLVILSVCFCNAVFSQIWNNPITGTNPNTANPYTAGQSVSSAYVTVSGIGRGSGINGINTNDRYNAKSWNTASINTNNYFYFTLTSTNINHVIDFSSFVYNATASPTGPTLFSFRSSLDNYATDIPSANGTGTTIDLSAAIYQNLSTITFRFFAWGASAGSGTFSIDNFHFNGSIADVTTTSLSGDYFRSFTTGIWNSASTWQSSHDGSTYFTATLIPDASAQSVTVQNGHTVTIDVNAKAQSLTVDAGGTLTHTSGVTLNIYNGASGYDFIVNGTYILNGNMPILDTTNPSFPPTAQINGLVRVDKNNPGGESDDFARDSKVWFTTGAVFQWNTTNFFQTNPLSGSVLTYFPNSGSAIPIFRVTQNVIAIGANKNTLFNSKLEIASGDTVKFQGGGAKFFRNGLGGDGVIYHGSIYGGAASPCGAFKIGDGVTSQTATIDGNIKIIIQGTMTSTTATGSSDFVIADLCTATLTGSPTIKVGDTTTYLGNPNFISGAIFEVDGKLTDISSNPIDLTYGRLKVVGTLSSSSTGTFKCSSTFTRIISAGAVANTSVGVLKLTTGYDTAYSLEMGDAGFVDATHRMVLGTDVVVANNITLTKGILVTDYKKLTLNYTSASSIVYPSTANYKNSFIATCDQNGSALVATGLSATTTSPFTGNVGFRINNVKGTSYIMFPVGPNFSRPNKIAINPNNNTTATSITIVVGNGDILYTPQPRVNRIWYVHNSDPGSDTAIGMQLYFTKYDWNVSGFGVGQDEIENGFNRFATYVGRRDYTTDHHLTHRSTPAKDIGALGTSEVYAEYLAASTVHLPGFYKFAVGNFATIILPVSIINVKAYKSGNNVNVEWSALHELNIDHYEVEHSSNGIAFTAISNTSANNNGSQQNNYTSTDIHPLNGNNFYRIKAIDKDGYVKYSSIVSVNMNSNYVGIKVLPNPVNNRLMNIQLSNLPAGKYDLLLYSANGQRVFTTNFTFNGGFSSQVVVLPLNIKTGAYILKLFNGTNKFTQNIMVE
jgi:hypothetical protein